MKKTRRLLTFALFTSAAALLVIIICGHQFRWGKHFPVREVTPEEMVSLLRTSNVSHVATDSWGGIWLETRLGFRYQTYLRDMLLPISDNRFYATALVVQILEKERGQERNENFALCGVNGIPSSLPVNDLLKE